MKFKKTIYYKSMKETVKKRTALFVGLDAVFLLFVIVAVLISAFFLKFGYFEVQSVGPQIMSLAKIANMRDVPGSILGSEIIDEQLQASKEAVIRFLLGILVSVLVFLALFLSGLGLVNGYIWSKIKKKKMEWKLWLSYLTIGSLMMLTWLIIYFLSIKILTTIIAPALIALEFFVSLFTFHIAFSLTDNKIGKSIIRVFTVPWRHIKHYILMMIFSLLTILILMNLFALILYPLIMVSQAFYILVLFFFLLCINWVRMYIQEINVKFKIH